MDPWAPSTTLREACRATFRIAAETLPESGVDMKQGFDVIDALTSEESDAPLSARTPGHTMITCDGTPFDVSVRFSGDKPELRCSFVPDSSSGAQAAWASALRVADRLETSFGAHLREYREIHRLFAPTDPRARPLHFAVAFTRSGAPTFKVYLHPSSTEVLENALHRLLPAAAIEKLRASILTSRAIMVSLDLIESSEPRIKVYVRNNAFSSPELAVFPALLESYEPGTIERLAKSLYGGLPAPTTPESEVGLTMIDIKGGGRVKGLTQYFHCNPVMLDLPDDEVLSDEKIKTGIHELFDHFKISGEGYDRIIDAFSMDDLSAELGLHAYVSVLFPQRGAPRSVTAYLNPRFFLRSHGFVVGASS